MLQKICNLVVAGQRLNVRKSLQFLYRLPCWKFIRAASLRQAACLPGGTYPTSPSGGTPLGHGPQKPLNAFI